MRKKRKISLTIDKKVCRAIDQVAKSRNIAKSNIAQKAFEFWLKKETEIIMAKGCQEMAKEYLMFAETAVDTQREILT